MRKNFPLVGTVVIVTTFLSNSGAKRHAKPLHPIEKCEAYTSCLKTNDTSYACRFNNDCCSGLCSTQNWYTTLGLPHCLENVPDNHQADSFATSPKSALSDRNNERNTYAGISRWHGKVAVITGAASGIGFALAKRLCNEGMIVVGGDINELGLKKTADHCPPNMFYPFTVDLRIEAEIIQFFRFINETVGRVNVLINNAGVGRFSPLFSVSSEALRTTFDVNLLAPILCTREALKIMFANKIDSGGHILFTNSVLGGFIPEQSYGQMMYVVSKHALRVVAEGLRRELRAKGSKIRVGQVAPSLTRTNLPDSYVPHDVTDKQTIAGIFYRRPAQNALRASPDEIVEAYMYILSAPEHLDINIVEFK